MSHLSEQTDLRFPVELAYRSNPGNTVTATGTYTQYAFSNKGVNQRWGRAGIELDRHLSSQTLLNGAVLVAGSGGDATWLGTVSMKQAF